MVLQPGIVFFLPSGNLTGCIRLRNHGPSSSMSCTIFLVGGLEHCFAIY